MRFDLLVEIAMPSGSLRYSIHGTTTEDYVWERRLESISDLVREVRPGGGVSTIQSARIRLRDADNALRKRATTEPYQGRQVTIWLADLDAGTMSTIFIGRIVQSSTNASLLTLEARDETWDLLQEPIPSILTFPDLFPHIPRTTPMALVPIVYGSVSSTSWDSRGHLPAYLVDPAIGQIRYRYVAAQHPLKAITAVYRDGEPVTYGWSVAYADVATAWGTKRMTFIDFVSDQRESAERDTRITYDAQGLTDTNLETGNLLTNPASILQAVLTTHGPLNASDFDSTYQISAENAYSTAGIVAGGAIVDSADTWLHVIRRFAESLSLQFFRTRQGKWAIRFDDGQVPPSTVGLPHITDAKDVVRDSYALTRQEALSRIEFAYAYDLARDAPAARAEQIDNTIYALLGRHASEKMDYMCIRSVNDGRKVAQIQLHQAAQARVQLTTTPIPDLELGDPILVTHYAGDGPDGFGWTGRTFRVSTIIIGVTNRGLRYRLGLIDCPGLTLGSYSDPEPGWTSVDPPLSTAEMFADLIFSPNDYDTVTWSAGTLKLVYGRRSLSYSITSGSTGNMPFGQNFYVYFDPSVSITSLLTTTTMDNAIGDNKRLIAVCRRAPSTSQNAIVDNRVGFVWVNASSMPRQSAGDQIPYNSIVNDHIRVGTIEANKLSANLIYTGTLTLKSGADEKAGMTAEGTGDSSIRIWAGDSFANRSSAPFRVTQGGTLYARGATIETAESGARLTLDAANGLRAIDSGGTVRVQISTQGEELVFRDAASQNGTGGGIIRFGSAGQAIYGWNNKIFIATSSQFGPFDSIVAGINPTYSGSATAELLAKTADISFPSMNTYASVKAYAGSAAWNGTEIPTLILSVGKVAGLKYARIEISKKAGQQVGIIKIDAGESQTTGNFIPATDWPTTSVYLGSSTNRFAGIYVGNSSITPVNATLQADSGMGQNSKLSAFTGIGYAIASISAGDASSEARIEATSSGVLSLDAESIGFFGVTAVARPTVTGSRGGNAALQSLLTSLANLGLIVDNTT